ncbi:uncharacterized protein LOC113769955 isoform X1 [Coffea eugenioides]|uniref:Uncharacterized protein isoform X1 n=1 Tax=Coffea arabica TaxID=13443 RepID=A0ABM4UB82_COFAR|nr:uncharacterized protein LOC113688163 isoform X1 [Coffea arabica]XP_027170102.1 uncharacterized protein LOC113769955 isoform X1 [Coffea eugenioides]
MADVMHEGHNTTGDYDIEYRSKDDDAWYSARVILDNDEKSLVVKLEGFSEASDLKFRADEFENQAAVEEFVKRFRSVSEQLQDRDCYQLVKGKKVCAALSFGLDDLRYYDAVVDDVRHQGHVLRDGEDECRCTFILCWLHGPRSGKLTIVNIANICTIQVAAPADLSIVSFAKFAKQNVQIACSKSCIVSTSTVGGPSKHKEVICLSSSVKSSAKSRSQDDDAVESFCGNRAKDEERVSLGADVDEDKGGYDTAESGRLHYILIDNLENDLSASSIRRFIHENTSVSPQAYLFPSRLSVPSASGAIASTSKKSLDQIYEFLINPNHLIVSARGRPWVIGKMVLSGAFQATLGSLPDESQDEFKKERLIKELQVVPSGTEAYKTAMQLRDLYIDFVNHEKLLYKRLAFEESRILKSSSSVETRNGDKRANACEGC